MLAKFQYEFELEKKKTTTKNKQKNPSKCRSGETRFKVQASPTRAREGGLYNKS